MGNSMQFPPGVYDISKGATRIARVLSLSTVLPNAPPIQWQPNKEHWFTTASLTNLNSYFNAATLRVSYVNDLGSLQKIATELADPSKYTFQLYAKGILSQSDWIAGAPSYIAPAYYLVQKNPPIPNRAMRPLFEVQASNSAKLARVTWVTLDNTVTNYFQNAAVGAFVDIEQKALSTIPSNGWYYRSP